MAKPEKASRNRLEHWELWHAFLIAQQRGNIEETAKAKAGIEALLSDAAARFRTALGRRDEAPAPRQALISWLDVLDMYLRINLPEDAKGSGPLGFLVCALADLDSGIFDPILRPALVDDRTRERKRSGRSPHGIRAVNFKVRCVLAADTAGDKEIFQRVEKAAAAYGVEVSRKDAIKEWRYQIRRARRGTPMADEAEKWNFLLRLRRGEEFTIDEEKFAFKVTGDLLRWDNSRIVEFLIGDFAGPVGTK